MSGVVTVTSFIVTFRTDVTLMFIAQVA